MAAADLRQLEQWLDQQIVGQAHLVQRLIISLLADGHLLVEGAPGLAKTRAIKSLGDALEGSFHRIQFTPDLLPGDITGTEIYRPQEASFHFQEGPVFSNLVLADEVNRAPAKVQSALLEAMAERQISVGSTSYELPRLFLVMATQNPIEQEGTYPLPEAQLDRFLLHVKVGYPNAEAERKILRLTRSEAVSSETVSAPQLSQESVFKAREEALGLHMADAVEEYIVQLVMATREPANYSEDLAHWLDYGGSPRATIALDRCARAHAWLNEKDFVAPDDVQAVAADVLRHRLLLSFEAEAAGVSSDNVIEELLRLVPVA
ncbi:MAG: MoxR family ATPase [Congregibacter sp.]